MEFLIKMFLIPFLFLNIFNTTALHIAVYKGIVEIVKLLLAHPAIDVNIKSIFN